MCDVIGLILTAVASPIIAAVVAWADVRMLRNIEEK